MSECRNVLSVLIQPSLIRKQIYFHFRVACHLVCLQRAGIFVTAWTVNDPALALQLSLMGVTGFITDDPETLAKPFPNRPPAA